MIGMNYRPGGVGRRHCSPQTLGAVDDDDPRLSGLLQLSQQVRTVIGGVATAVGLQHHPLHWRLQESLHLDTDVSAVSDHKYRKFVTI